VHFRMQREWFPMSLRVMVRAVTPIVACGGKKRLKLHSIVRFKMALQFGK